MGQKSREISVCEVFCSDEEKVKMVESRLKDIDRMANIFKALGDETRCRIIFALSLEELCVCDLANIVRLTVPAVSYHLRILRDLALVKARREGKVIFYSLDDLHIFNLLLEAKAHIEEEKRGR